MLVHCVSISVPQEYKQCLAAPAKVTYLLPSLLPLTRNNHYELVIESVTVYNSTPDMCVYKLQTG
jgi:hypothetical protein